MERETLKTPTTGLNTQLGKISKLMKKTAIAAMIVVGTSCTDEYKDIDKGLFRTETKETTDPKTGCKIVKTYNIFPNDNNREEIIETDTIYCPPIDTTQLDTTKLDNIQKIIADSLANFSVDSVAEINQTTKDSIENLIKEKISGIKDFEEGELTFGWDLDTKPAKITVFYDGEKVKETTVPKKIEPQEPEAIIYKGQTTFDVEVEADGNLTEEQKNNIANQVKTSLENDYKNVQIIDIIEDGTDLNITFTADGHLETEITVNLNETIKQTELLDLPENLTNEIASTTFSVLVFNNGDHFASTTDSLENKIQKICENNNLTAKNITISAKNNGEYSVQIEKDGHTVWESDLNIKTQDANLFQELEDQGKLPTGLKSSNENDFAEWYNSLPYDNVNHGADLSHFIAGHSNLEDISSVENFDYFRVISTGDIIDGRDYHRGWNAYKDLMFKRTGYVFDKPSNIMDGWLLGMHNENNSMDGQRNNLFLELYQRLLGGEPVFEVPARHKGQTLDESVLPLINNILDASGQEVYEELKKMYIGTPEPFDKNW